MQPFWYVPNVPQAILTLGLQLVIFGILAWALFAFSRQRHHPRHVLVALAVGAAIGWIGGLAYQIWPIARQSPGMAHVWGEVTGWLLIAYIELHWSTLSVFFGILASWASLEIVGPFVYPRPAAVVDLSISADPTIDHQRHPTDDQPED